MNMNNRNYETSFPVSEEVDKPESGGRKLSRRDFLKLVGVAFAELAAYKYDQLLSNLFGTKYEEYIEQTKEIIKMEYGLDIVTGLPINAEGANITGREPNRYELSRALGLITEELTKYPPDMLKNNGVKAIRLLSSARADGKPIFGVVSEFNKGIIVLCYTAEPFEIKRRWYRRAFHHELYHLLDSNDDGYEKDDEKWRSFHGCGNCLVYASDSGAEGIESKPEMSQSEWFLLDYGQTSPAEDRAVFAAVVMIPRLHADLLKTIREEENDQVRSVLEKKYEDTLYHYYKWSGGVMDKKYFDDLVDGKVDRGYFE